MSFPSDGVSYYWGEIYISLETGRIMGGKILERVDLNISQPQAKQSFKHVTLREITLKKLKKEDFDRLTDGNIESYLLMSKAPSL
jgi:hypothetical protein